jgi:hypothetical protein
MADEINRYEQIQRALQKTCADLMRESAKMVENERGYPSPRLNSFDEDAAICRQAMGSPGLIAGLAKELFGEVDE